ncbi:MAG: carboxypeptidase regulatory-like domain-containing protein [Acidobacteriota bacterium]
MLTSLLFSASLFAQQANDAIVVGTVVDGAGASVQGALVTVLQASTQSAVQVRTDSRGQFRTPLLRIGDYSVLIEADGFKRYNERNITLNIGDVRRIDATLQIGQVSESVTVEDRAPLLQTSDSTVGTVITNKQIQELPLNGRDYLQLAALSSGTFPSGQGVSIGGQAGTQVAFLLDGQDNNSQQISTGHSGQKEIVKPSVDAVQEFKVVTNSYSAEYGRSSSGVVSVALKSGSNDIHGSLFEFFRNEALDAKNLFATTKSPYRQNQYGATIGGPILRNKLFYFGDFQIGRLRQSSTTTSTLPTVAQKGGLFTSSIKDPTTGQPFVGNLIPVTRFDPIATKIAAFFPNPQTTAATRNYVYASPRISDPYSYDFRTDYVINDKQNLYFRYSKQQSDNGVTAGLPPDPDQGYYTGGGAETSDSKSFLLTHNKVWSPTIISSVRLGWNYLYWENIVPPQKLAGIGIPGVQESNPGFSQIAITGYPSLGITNVPNTDGSQNRQIAGDVTWSKANHTFKFGLQAYWLQTNFFSSQRSSGIFNFNGQYTGNAFADFLLGAASSSSLSKFAYLRFRQPYTHFFVQDDWRATRKLTFNIGLRYELTPPAVDKQDKIANYDMDTNPLQPKIVLAGAEGSGRASRALQNVNYHMFAPRIGFAYELPGGKTVIRGGYGIFYSNFITLGGMQSLEINPPNHVRVAFSTDRNAQPTIVLKNGFPSDALSVANAQSVNLISYDRRNVPPTAQQWNFNLQRQLPGGIVVEAGYFGNKFENNWRQIDGNPAPPGPGDINARRLFRSAAVPGTPYAVSLANVTRINKDGYSNYNALQAKAEKRFATGLSFLVSYAFSKTIALDDGYQDYLNQGAERSVASLNRKHHLVGSAVYQLPFGRSGTIGKGWNRWVDGALGGWSVSPIVSLDSGAPLNLSVNGNPSNTGQSDRPNVVGDWRLDSPTIQRWFNTAAFVANAPYTYGNAGRNILLGPGRYNLDLGIHKTFRIKERIQAQFRFESFNTTNTPPLGNPNTQVGNVNFGQISSAGAPRNNQVALKILF